MLFRIFIVKFQPRRKAFFFITFTICYRQVEMFVYISKGKDYEE